MAGVDHGKRGRAIELVRALDRAERRAKGVQLDDLGACHDVVSELCEALRGAEFKVLTACIDRVADWPNARGNAEIAAGLARLCDPRPVELRDATVNVSLDDWNTLLRELEAADGEAVDLDDLPACRGMADEVALVLHDAGLPMLAACLDEVIGAPIAVVVDRFMAAPLRLVEAPAEDGETVRGLIAEALDGDPAGLSGRTWTGDALTERREALARELGLRPMGATGPARDDVRPMGSDGPARDGAP